MGGELRRSILLSMTIVGIAITVFFVAGFFLSRDLATVAARIAEVRHLLAERLASLSLRASFRSAGAQVDLYESRLAAIVPLEEDLLEFPRWLESTGRGSGLAGTKVSFRGQSGGGASLGVLSFSAFVEGPVESIIDFFERGSFRADRYLTTFSGFDLSGSGGGQLGGTIEGRTYFRPSTTQ